MFKAVYDTNVIVSAALHKDRLPASLLSLALEGKVRLFVSEELLREYEGILKRPNSTFGYPIVVVDTCNNKKDAEKYLEDLSEEKKSNT